MTVAGALHIYMDRGAEVQCNKSSSFGGSRQVQMQQKQKVRRRAKLQVSENVCSEAGGNPRSS